MQASFSVRALMLPLSLVSMAGVFPEKAEAAAWYRGDLHNHSVHSDGDGTVREIITAAEQRGLDFLAITDHDGSMSGIISTWTDPDFNSTRTELLYGAEWTTGQGHANVWSDQPYDYTPLWEANRANDVTRAIDAAHEQGVLFSINHPEAYGCCPWKYDSLENVDAIEVWNSTFRLPSFNDLAVDNLWDGLLLTGFAPTAVGGSDTHYWHGKALDYKSAGNPTTWVYADDPTPESILRGISAGNVTISYSPDAPRLELLADPGKDGTYDVIMGESMPAQLTTKFLARLVNPDGTAPSCAKASQKVPVSKVINGFQEPLPPSVVAHALRKGVGAAEGQLLVIVKDGKVLDSVLLGCATGSYEFQDVPSPGSYYRLELVGVSGLTRAQSFAYGYTLSVSNPIFAW